MSWLFDEARPGQSGLFERTDGRVFTLLFALSLAISLREQLHRRLGVSPFNIFVNVTVTRSDGPSWKLSIDQRTCYIVLTVSLLCSSSSFFEAREV